MWEELSYSLETEEGIRHLVIRSNYEKTEQGLIDHGDYSVYEDLTPFETMTVQEVDEHFAKAGHWNAAPYLDAYGVFLGQLYINLANPDAFIWDGKLDDLPLLQQTQLVSYLTTTDFDPDIDFDHESGDDVFASIPFLGKEGLQPDGSIMLLDSYKANAIRISLVPLDYGYQIFFDGEPVGRIVPGDIEGWKTQEALFQDDDLVNRLGAAIDAAIAQG